jgi:hypothetical protein
VSRFTLSSRASTSPSAPSRRLPVRPLLGLALLLTAASPAVAVVVNPFTEEFGGGAANWRQNTSTLDVNTVATGGPNGAGDAYATYARNMGTSTGVQVTFRGQATANASGGAFSGNYLAAAVNEVSYWVRHDAPAPLTIGTRFAAGNFPAFSIFAPGTVAPNTWTKVTVAVTPTNPGWQNEGVAGATTAEQFNTLFADIGNLQVFAQRDATVPDNTTVTFSLDKVQIVPEPTGLAAVGGTAVTGLLARRRRARG